MTGRTFRETLLGWLFPARCLSCGRTVPAGEPLCPDCAKSLRPAPYRRQYSPPGSGSEGLQVLSPLSYQEGFRRSMNRFKFRGKRALAEPFARLMAKAVPDPSPFDGVAWVPLSASGKRRRGYDQSELLARAAARELGLPPLPLLEKVRETDTQHELSRAARAKNIRGAYRASPEAAGKSLLLVDDIVTTGATLTECAEALYRAGARHVTALCACDTPAVGESGR